MGPAKSNLVIAAGTVKCIEPHPDATALRWKVQLKLTDGVTDGASVRVSQSGDVSATKGVQYAPGEGETLIGDPSRVAMPLYFYALGGTAEISWD